MATGGYPAATIFFISFSAQAIESLVEVPVTALASMLGRMIRVGDELHLVGRRRRPAVGVVLHSLTLERGVLGIGPEHRMVLELLVGGQVEGVARHDVLVVDLALAEQVADPLLGRLDVLRELPDADVARGVGLVAAAGPGQAPVVVDAVGGDQLRCLATM